MIPAFAEAVRATTQPCTLLLIAAPICVALTTRGRMRPMFATLAGAVVGGWVFMSNTLVLEDGQLQLSGLLVIAAVGVLGAGAAGVGRVRWATDVRVQSAIAAGVAFVSTLWWRPCVGRELGAILTDSRDGLLPQVPAMTAYMVGAMVPVVAVTLVIRAVQPKQRATAWFAGGAVAGAVLIGGALAIGEYDQLVSTLTRWSTA